MTNEQILKAANRHLMDQKMQDLKRICKKFHGINMRLKRDKQLFGVRKDS